MREDFKVAVFSPNDPRPWVRDENLDFMLNCETLLIKALQSKGYRVVRGGEGFPREDQLAWNTTLVQEQVKRLAAFRPGALVINQGSWTFPYDSIDAVKLLSRLTGDAPRVVMFCYKDTRVPGLVAGMSSGGGLKRIGIPFATCYGKIDREPAVLQELVEILDFYRARWEAVPEVEKVASMLPFQKYLAVGGMSLKMATTTADVDQWQKIFGISYEALDQSVLLDRAAELVEWEGLPGSGCYRVRDPRVSRSISFLTEEGHGRFYQPPAGAIPEKFILQIALYYAALDLFDDLGVTFAGIKCQDELSAGYCTACPAAAFLNNDVGPDGAPKRVIPVACENDMDSALSQLLLHLLSGEPSGFGDFRDVDGGVLAIVNCGQHPPFFFGAPREDPLSKLDRAQYPAQEYYYAAGGNAVRGRTPGGLTVTVARLGRQNLRYELVAAVMQTVEVAVDEHELYTPAWPVMKGKLPIDDRTIIDAWPCNHLAFSYADLTPALPELAHRLDIGFRIFDSFGREHYKPS